MKPEDRHLLRAADQPASIRDLAGPTGLSRLSFDELRIGPGETFVLEPRSPADPAQSPMEWFIYVLSGRGRLATTDERAELAPGDFLGLPAQPGGRLENTGASELVCLCGGEKAGYAWQRLETER